MTMLDKTNLHNYQVKAVNHIIANTGCALFLDMGLGKTVSTLTALEILITNRRISKPLIIAPLRVAQSTWSDELTKWEHLKSLTISKILGTLQERKRALQDTADMYIINRENIPWLVETIGNKWDFDMIVIDELSSFKSAKSKRFKALRKVLGLTKRIVGLTGTPTPNGLMDLWAQIYLIDKGERLGNTITSYRNNYFTPGRGNGYITYEWILRPQAYEQINSKLADICISMQASDYLELPELIINEIPITLPAKLMAQYKEFEREKIMEIANETITSANAAVLANQLRQFTSGALYQSAGNADFVELHNLKIDALLELQESITGSILVGYEFKHELQRIKEAMPSFRIIDTPADLRAWNDQKIPIAGGHPASMGHGLNLQRGGNTIIWVTPPWSLELYQQFNARLYRQGQDKPVYIHHLVCTGTIDERVMRVLRSKGDIQQSVLDAINDIRKELRR